MVIQMEISSIDPVVSFLPLFTHNEFDPSQRHFFSSPLFVYTIDLYSFSR